MYLLQRNTIHTIIIYHMSPPTFCTNRPVTFPRLIDAMVNQKSKRGGCCREPKKPAGVSALAALRKLIEKLFAIGLWLTTSSSTSPSLYHRPRPQHYTQLYPGSKGMSLE